MHDRAITFADKNEIKNGRDKKEPYFLKKSRKDISHGRQVAHSFWGFMQISTVKVYRAFYASKVGGEGCELVERSNSTLGKVLPTVLTHF